MRLITSVILIWVVQLILAYGAIAQSSDNVSVEDNATPLVRTTEEWQAILDEGQHSKELYMQLGYTYYQEGDLANAMLYYEKADRLAPRDLDIADAIKLVRSQIPVQITDIPDFVLWRIYQSTANLMTSTSWSALQLFLSLLLLGATYLFLFRQASIPLSKRWLTIGILVVGILFTSLMTYQRQSYLSDGSTGVSLDYQDLYEAPDDRSGTVTSIGPGNKVFLIDTIGDWYKVQLRDKDLGWVKRDRISII